ncbi:MAG: hypothetical protein ABFS23_02535 [Pseudomonadota bacterium]
MASLALTAAPANAALDEIGDDPHYTPGGFFDIHICNWPEREPFFKLVFSTFDYDDVSRVIVRDPQGQQLADMDFAHYVQFESRGRPKRAFVNDMLVPADARSGWYTADILFRDGRTFRGEDWVETGLLPLPEPLLPADGAEEVLLPVSLSWEPVAGATHYQVFVRDLWNERNLVFRSKIVPSTTVSIPAGKLEPGGWYEWLVHARDVHEDPRLGDFNLGSQTRYFQFTVKED